MRNKTFFGNFLCGMTLAVCLAVPGMSACAEESAPAETVQETEASAPDAAPAVPHDIAGADIADYAGAAAFYGDTAANYTYDIEVPGASVKEIHIEGKKMSVSTDSNLREGPSTDTGAKLVMSTGTVVNVIAYTDNDWSRIFFIQETPGEAAAEGETPEPVRTVVTGYVKSTLLVPVS